MEHLPDNSDDKDKDMPEHEQLYPGEIDLTGAVEQDDALRDVIGDAIAEAEFEGGDVPDWGARTIARALANRLGPTPGALHHYAATGNVHLSDIAPELAYLYSSGDDEVRDWVNILGTYLVNQAETARHADSSSAEVSPLKPDTSLTSDIPQVAVGIQVHGDAFRAYLQLPDVNPKSPDLLKRFQEFYIDSFDSMSELIDKLTDRRKGLAAIDKAAEDWGLEGFVIFNEAALVEVVQATWDIVEYQGRWPDPDSLVQFE